MKTSPQIKQAVEVLKKGGVVIFPTETAYGVGCRLNDPAAIKLLIKMRGRAENKPFLVLVNSLEVAKKYWQKLPPKVEKLAKKYWPGPLTIIYYCQQNLVPSEVRAGGKTLGIRLSDHKIMRKLVTGAGAPVLAPSANLAGEPAPYQFSKINPKLLRAVDFALNLPCGQYQKPSTVIDCTQKPWQILRQGAVIGFDIEIGG